MIKDTNPDHYKVDGANFLEYMDDPKISWFGNWMFANGFNSGVWAATNWVSVKDRLPELDKDVLVYAVGKIDGYFGKSAIEVCNRFIMRVFPSSPGHEMWSSPWQFFHTDYEITHWMQLPEPPKEVQDESDH